MRLTTLIFLICNIFYVSCVTPPPRRATGKWSEFQGKMTFDQAGVVCKSLNQRLPSLEEMKHAFDAGLTKPWQVDGKYYWTQTPAFGGGNFVFITEGGNVFYNFKNDDYFLVRCFLPDAVKP